MLNIIFTHHHLPSFKNGYLYRKIILLMCTLILLLHSLLSQTANARLVFLSNDGIFQNATIVPFSVATGFVQGAQNVQLNSNGVDFNFTTTNAFGLANFLGTLESHFPDGVTVTFNQPLAAIGFQFDLAECQGFARFIGTAGNEEHTFAFGQGGIFIGATDIGAITSVQLNGTCAFARWSEMRFVSGTLPPPTNQADLSMAAQAPNVASQLNGSIDFDLTTTNNGSDTATAVQIVNFPPGGTQLLNSSPSTPLVSANGRVIVMGVGDLPNTNQYTNTLNTTIPPFELSGLITQNSGVFQCNSRMVNIALTTGSSIDPDPTNNTALSVTHFDNSSRFGMPEICDNAIDDNCDGRVDCGDNTCAGAANCRPPRLLNASNNPPSPCPVVNSLGVCLNNAGPWPFPGTSPNSGTPPSPPPPPPPPQSCELTNVHGNPISAPACCCSYGECDRARCDALKYSIDPNIKTANPPVSSQGYGITQAGRLHDYTITYENIGDADAIDVRIYDALALELDDTTLQINDGGVYDPNTRVITWNDPLLPPQQPRSVSFSINVRSDLQPGDRIRNQATILFPNALQPRNETNFVEHTIEDPNNPAIADLGVVECLETATGSNEWQLVLFNRGTAFAHNATAQVLNPPQGIIFTDNSAKFGRSDDTDPEVIGTVVPLGSTHSIDTVAFTANTPASVCKALNWRITYTSSDGELISHDVQVASDTDMDGVADIDDNCPDTANLDQFDSNQNGVGDACEAISAPLCGDLDADDDVDRADNQIFISALRATRGDQRYIQAADLDDDSDIDFSDYQLWYQCYQNYLAQ